MAPPNEVLRTTGNHYLVGQPFRTLVADHVITDFEMQTGCSNTQCVLMGAVYQLPQDAARVWLSLPAVVETLQVIGDEPMGHWLNKRTARWKGNLLDMKVGGLRQAHQFESELEKFRCIDLA